MITIIGHAQSGATQAISATTTSASATISTNTAAVRIANPGTTVCFARATTGSSTAVATDFPILPGQDAILTKQYADDTVSVVMASGTATIYVTPVFA